MWDVTYNLGSETWGDGRGERYVTVLTGLCVWVGGRVVSFQGLLVGGGDSKFTLRTGL
jgi:hypothetical protein